jgi:hypothetical protein
VRASGTIRQGVHRVDGQGSAVGGCTPCRCRRSQSRRARSSPPPRSSTTTNARYCWRNSSRSRRPAWSVSISATHTEAIRRRKLARHTTGAPDPRVRAVSTGAPWARSRPTSHATVSRSTAGARFRPCAIRQPRQADAAITEETAGHRRNRPGEGGVRPASAEFLLGLYRSGERAPC